MTTSELRLSVPRPLSGLRVDAPGVVAGAVAGSAVLGWAVVTHPHWYRFMLAGFVGFMLVLLAFKLPRAAAIGTLLFLPFMALVRRLLIADAGWTTYDPLLLVAPAVAVVLAYRLLVVERRRVGTDTVSRLVMALLGLCLLQVFNPLGQGPIAGMAGLLYLAVPLLWFFIGRELGDRRAVLFLMYAVIGIAVAEGIYGLIQTQSGLPPWDERWVNVAGFAALGVGQNTAGGGFVSEIRAFGSFPSATEYAAFLGVGMVFATALAFHRRLFLVPAIAFLAVALFLASGRAVLVLAILGVLVMVALRARDRSSAALVLVIGVSTIFGVAAVFGPSLDRIAGRSDNPFVSHQLGGLLNPLDPDKSTLIGHLNLFTDGIETGVTHPLGRGTASTNLAGSRFGNTRSGSATELDLSDSFYAFGILGGVLFLAVILLTFRKVILRYLDWRDPVVLGVTAMLCVTLGQWLNGGHYTLSSLTWFAIGWATRDSSEKQQA
jgi:hypothetical protein